MLIYINNLIINICSLLIFHYSQLNNQQQHYLEFNSHRHRGDQSNISVDISSGYLYTILYAIIINNMESEKFSESYPVFTIPESLYQIVLINKYISIEMMDKVLNHIYDCHQYTIDTENEKSNNKLSIIQVQTFPPKSPSMILLIELFYQPQQGSQLYVRVRDMFRFIFRSSNEIYSWGDINRELEPAKDLLVWPIQSRLINIQPHFGNWYEGARSRDETRCPEHHSNVIMSDVNNDNYLSSKCKCYYRSPYRQNENWSLQNAMIYAAHMFLDKKTTNE